MTLREYIEQNADKEIEIREDGTVWIVEPEGPWKPETGERYYVVSDIGSVGPFCWWGNGIDKRKLDIGNVFQTEEEAKRMVCRLKARKKFLDAGGHEGNDGAYKQYMGIGFFWIASPMSTGTGINPVIVSAQPAIGIWFETSGDCGRAIDSLTDDEKAALCWMGE